MSVTKAALANALAAIFVPPLMLGLRSGLSEVRDGGYKQQPISLTSPKSVDGVREITINAEVRFGPFLTDFEEEIDKSWKEYVEQVGAEMAETDGKEFWRLALNDVLAKGEEVF